MTFKFEKYAYQPDPEFDDYEFIKFENLKDKVIRIKSEPLRLTDDGACKMVICFDEKPEVEYCTYTKAKSIVNTLKNILDEEGTIPFVPVRIGTYPTSMGRDGYCFKDVE